MEFWIKIGLYFVLRIGLLICSGFALISPWLPNNHFCRVYIVALNWMEESLGNQVSQQNIRVGVTEEWTTHTYLCGYEVMSVWKKSFLFCLVFLTKCPSAALRAELPVGWLRLEGVNDSHMIAFCLFAVLYKWTITEELLWRTLAWKSPFSGTQSKKRICPVTKCTDFFMFVQIFRFLLDYFFLGCTQKEDPCSWHHFKTFSSWLSVYCVRNVVELSYIGILLESFYNNKIQLQISYKHLLNNLE